jgi:hypothetical protein
MKDERDLVILRLREGKFHFIPECRMSVNLTSRL